MDDFGVHPVASLLRDGMSPRDVRRAVEEGQLQRLRHGWMAADGADPLVVEAVRAGGCLTCVAALKLHGFWIPPRVKALHVRGTASAHRRHPRRFCRQYGGHMRVDAAVDEPVTALRHALRCLTDEQTIVVTDSMLHCRYRDDAGTLEAAGTLTCSSGGAGKSGDDEMESGLIVPTVEQIRSAFDGAPKSVRRLLDECDPKAASGIESITRVRIRRKGVRLTTQAHIPGVGHVDMLIGDRLVVEVDGYAFHSEKESFQEDRRRNQVQAAGNYVYMPFTYDDVIDRWPHVEATIMGAVHNGVHLNPRRRSTTILTSDEFFEQISSRR
ncbi:type IV toxin-antitoxin system AbiEi family antitoxin domain-containing protein [Gordonia sp. 852002-51296_SCH5728562-b]|uniref:type IV toxin-antitoxin system AbiEi family antitoxin domain-containing protein n=1 Tax=Gordonia sp. 852002-51296_SCH5728562-b TaxID=1834101 RepID=UPI0007EAC67B|nr:type IV toxin-antitoxin system AbiEi family antitoxin domain-containing protein [Gordonia sp. 852002-51296_SCH5728562-b]OBA30853.1 hypothetical protein A5766_15020 [Gordonia sp. 852002-51296_SCH5728562-b]